MWARSRRPSGIPGRCRPRASPSRRTSDCCAALAMRQDIGRSATATTVTRPVDRDASMRSARLTGPRAGRSAMLASHLPESVRRCLRGSLRTKRSRCVVPEVSGLDLGILARRSRFAHSLASWRSPARRRVRPHAVGAGRRARFRVQPDGG